MEAGWGDLVHDLAIDLARLQHRQFVVVEYNTGIDPNPYAQACPEPGGWYCEVMSAHFLPEEIWTLDAGFLTVDGWQGSSPREWCAGWRDPSSGVRLRGR